MSCSLYSAHIWSFRYLHSLVELQSHFYKKLLGVERTVPHYLIRLETGAKPMLWRVMKQAFTYWFKVWNMDSSRYVKKCFSALLRQWENENGVYTYNWVMQFAEITKKLGFPEFCSLNNLADANRMQYQILDKIIEIGRQDDIELMQKSARNVIYSNLCTQSPEPAKYLTLKLPFNKLSLLAQSRLNNQRFYFEKFKHNFDTESFCKLCNKKEEENLYHFIFNCRLNDEYRKEFDDIKLGLLSEMDWNVCLKLETLSCCQELFMFLQQSLRYRRIILEE